MISSFIVGFITTILYLLHSSVVFAGTVNQGKTPIFNTIANKGQNANYTFQVVPQTSIPKGGKITVTFPYQYPPGLGVYPVLEGTCNMHCEIFGQKVFFFFDDAEILGSIQYNLTISGVMNPKNAGGTGNFYVETSRGSNKYDENLMFGSLGVAGDIDTLTSTTVAVDSTGSTSAGVQTKYNFAFKTTTYIPQNSYLELWIPSSGYSISTNPSCATYPINGITINGTIACSCIPGSNIIHVEGFTQNIVDGSNVGITVTMTNPTVSVFTGNFRIVVYRYRTKVVLCWSNSLAGLQITPGVMQSISLTQIKPQAVQAQAKLLDYKLKFLTTNPLPLGSLVEITFPSDGSISLFDYNSDFLSSYQLLYGLDDISTDSTLVDTDVSSSYIRFSNYAAQTIPTEIAVFFRVTIPSLPGVSNAISVTTYTSIAMTSIIDQDSSSITITVSAISSANAAVLLENSSAKFLANQVITNTLPNPPIPVGTGLVINFTPPLSIPAGSVYKFIFDEDFTLSSVDSTLCFINSAVSSICKRTDSLVTLYSSSLVGSAITSSVQGSISLKQFITAPVIQGSYLLDVCILNASQTTVLFTFSALLIITPQYISTITPKVYMDFKNGAPNPSYYTRYGILEIELTTEDLTVPKGSPSSDLTQAQGFIDVLFLNNYDSKLGSALSYGDEFYCKGIDGLFSEDNGIIKCNMIRASYADPVLNNPPSSYTAIRMKYFKQISPGTVLKFHIPNIQNPLINPGTILVLLKQKINRREYILNLSLVQTITYNSAIAPVGAIGLNSNSYIIFNTIRPYLQTMFSFKFFIEGLTQIYLGDFFIIIFPKFDTGFFPSDNSVGFSILVDASGAEYIQKTVVYFDINQLLVEIISTPPVGYFTAGSVHGNIINLIYPRYSYAFGTLYVIRIPYPLPITNQPNLKDIVGVSLLGSPDNIPFVNDFQDVQILVPFKASQFPGSYFEFYIVPSNDLIEGFSIQITFSPQFNLQKSFPSVEFSAPQLNALDVAKGIVYTVSSNIVTISNLKAHPAGSPFRIIIDGVKNPDLISQVTTGWSILAYYQNPAYIINYRAPFSSYTTGSAFASDYVIFQGISAFPNNAQTSSTYTVSFTPSSSFRAFALIQITFPISDFSTSQLPQTPICKLQGGLTTFKSCSISGNTFTIVTESKYNSDAIQFIVIFSFAYALIYQLKQVKDIMNPTAGTTSGFIVQIFYDGVLVQDTDTLNSNLRTLTITNRASLLQIKQLDFFPTNEAEIAIYTFTIIPSFTLDSSILIYIEFPPKFDQLLGNSLKCQSVGGITSEISCPISDRTVTVSGISSYEPSFDDPIVLKLSGVMNPNENQDRSDSYFKIGLYQQFTYNFIDYNDQVDEGLTTSAPTWLELETMYPSNYFIRRSSVYYMEFIIATTYPLPSYSSQGEIIIEFPSGYDVPDAQILDCTSTTSDMETLSCDIENNKVSVVGNLVSISGLAELYINNLLNPTEIGSTDPIIIKLYDGFNKNIISRTFYNIDPSDFSFSVPGPLITVNGNSTIIVERGTQTEDLYITVIYPCALNLTLIPTVTQEGIEVIPNQISLNLGDLKAKFRVSVLQSLNAGYYYIYWTTTGEESPPIYTAIKKSKIQVTANKNIRISIGVIQEIPLGGWSLPTIVSTLYAPNLSLEVLIQFKAEQEGITLSSKSLLFSQGTNYVQFYLNCSSAATATGGTLVFSLDGINADVYSLSETSIDFTIISADFTPPTVTDLANSTTTQTSVILTIGTSEVSLTYFMIALVGTPVQTYTSVQIQKTPRTVTKTKYGTAIIGKTNQAIYTFSGLQAQVSYVVYAYAVDRAGLWSAVKTLQFSTNDRYSAANFQLQFLQSYLNSAEKTNIKKEVAFVLSLNQTQQQKIADLFSNFNQSIRVIERQYTFTSRRALYGELNDFGYDQYDQDNSSEERQLTDTATIIIHLQIISNPFTENFFSPYNLVKYMIDNQMTMLSGRTTNLNTAYTITYSEFVKYTPSFITTPKEVDVSTNQVILEVELNNYGWVFAMATKTIEDQGKPSSQQIQWGLNSTNFVVPSWKVEIPQSYVAYNITIPGMVPNTEYNVYIIGGSVHPGYPDLMITAEVQLIDVTTLFIPSLPYLDLSASRLSYYVWWILVAMTLQQ